MSNRELLFAFGLLLLATPAAAERKGGWSVAACRKACMLAHDSKVVACKTLRSSDRSCLSDAASQRKKCEAACRKPRPKKKG